MRKAIIVMVLLICCASTAYAEGENTAVPFTAYPGFYIAGEDFPVGDYEIRCAKDTQLVYVSIIDANGNTIIDREFSANTDDWIAKICLLEEYEIQVSGGSAYFAPSAGGIVFDTSKIATTSDDVDNTAYQPLVLPAIDVLKEHWKESYAKDGMSKSGYLEIKNTRIIWIQDGLAGSESTPVKQFFGNVDYIIEFVLYTDYFGSEPYYNNAWIDNCVVVYTDGTRRVVRDQFELYRSRSYNMDYSGIIERIVDLGSEYNSAYRLLDE